MSIIQDNLCAEQEGCSPFMTRFLMYLVHPDLPDCEPPTAGPLCSCPHPSHPPPMKGSPERTTSEHGLMCESSLKGKIESLHMNAIKKKVRVGGEKPE